MDKYVFFDKYAIDEKAFNDMDISWDALLRIYEDYENRISDYEEIVRTLAEALNREKSIHSIKYRVKDKEHLMEKIIRKSIADPGFSATLENYTKNVKDLAGLRALHLFKEEWVNIHYFLAANWEFYTKPRANYKKGDPKSLLDMYGDAGCLLNEHKHGYRSIHYHLLIQSGRREMVAEIQVRTLFEEAWSEIDHYFRYSVKHDADQAEPYLGILNNITSNADALASYINLMETYGKTGENGGAERQALSVRDIYRRVSNG
jgi:ppGpp synthetase/RelA/SpoT-type nucleotidyltranferase